MLTIVGWLWGDPACHTQYKPLHVYRWAEMIERNLTLPHRFVVFSDVELVPRSNMEVFPLWSDHHLLRHDWWRREFPQCFVRLKAFSKEFAEFVGPRYASIDLDCVVTGNLESILGRKEPFLIWRRPILVSEDRLDPYNASMWMMNTGCRPSIWEDFKGAKSLAAMPQEKRFLYTDQGWMLHKLGLKEPGWTMDDGVFMWSYLQHKALTPPKHTKIVFFNGKLKPWDYDWIGDYYYGT